MTENGERSCSPGAPSASGPSRGIRPAVPSSARCHTARSRPSRATRPSASTALGRFLLGRTADFRKETYASPNNSITEAALDRYHGFLTERCTPVTSAQGTAPPTYRDCTPPPGSNVSAAAWTAVSNQIIAELWAAAGVVGYYTILDNIETMLFQDQQGSIPASTRPSGSRRARRTGAPRS